jgi:hypothetical protein
VVGECVDEPRDVEQLGAACGGVSAFGKVLHMVRKGVRCGEAQGCRWMQCMVLVCAGGRVTRHMFGSALYQE